MKVCFSLPSGKKEGLEIEVVVIGNRWPEKKFRILICSFLNIFEGRRLKVDRIGVRKGDSSDWALGVGPGLNLGN